METASSKTNKNCISDKYSCLLRILKKGESPKEKEIIHTRAEINNREKKNTIQSTQKSTRYLIILIKLLSFWLDITSKRVNARNIQ